MGIWNNSRSMVAATAAVMLLSSSAEAAQLLTNGDFSAGLAGWTPTTTANGVANHAAAIFNVTGSGPQSAAELKVGVASFSFGNPAAGGGLLQNFASAGGLGVFSASIAALGGPLNTNSEGGIFTVLLNGVEKDRIQVGTIGANVTVRSRLSFTDTLLAGNNSLEIRAVRPFLANDTPRQYFTNVSLVGAAVPETATWAMFIAGFGLVGASLRRRSAAAAVIAQI